MATSAWGVRERVLLAVVAVLAVVVGLLLRRHRLSDQQLAAERRQLSVAVNNIPQGLVLYDASARIIICNQPYLDMFGLSAAVARPGAGQREIFEHSLAIGNHAGRTVDEIIAYRGGLLAAGKPVTFQQEVAALAAQPTVGHLLEFPPAVMRRVKRSDFDHPFAGKVMRLP